jgi:hypothetical protein
VADIVEFEVDPVEATNRILRDNATGLFNHMRAVFLACDKHIWNNEFGLTPQQAFDAVGTRAVTLVDLLSRVAVAINATGPNATDVVSSKPAGMTITKNADGTVTLS